MGFTDGACTAGDLRGRRVLLGTMSVAGAVVLMAMLGGFWLARWTGVVDAGTPYGFRATAFALVTAGFAASHAWATRGRRFAARFAVIAMITSLAVESLGVLTGWVFGVYEYAPDFRLKILGLVPVVIPLIWFSMSYLAFDTCETVLARAPAPRRLPLRPLKAGLSAGLLLGYDLVADPNHVARGGWSYAGGGFFYGVPLQNFVAWYAIGFAMFWALHRGLPCRGSAPGSPPWYLAMGTFMYIAIVAHESAFAFVIARLPGAGAVGIGLLAMTTVLLVRSLKAARLHRRSSPRAAKI